MKQVTKSAGGQKLINGKTVEPLQLNKKKYIHV